MDGMSVLPPGHYSFDVRHLSILSYGHKFHHWHYRAAGPVNIALTPGFFDHCAGRMLQGDLMTISGTDGTAQRVVYPTARGRRIELGFPL